MSKLVLESSIRIIVVELDEQCSTILPTFGRSLMMLCGRVDQSFLEQIRTPDLEKVTCLDEMARCVTRFGNAGLARVSQDDDRDHSSVSILLRVHGKPQMKMRTNAQMRHRFIFAKQV